MAANVIVTVEREFDYPRPEVFRAWTAPAELAQWRGSPGWRITAFEGVAGGGEAAGLEEAATNVVGEIAG